MKRTLFLLFVIMSFSMPKLFSQEISYDLKVSYNENHIPLSADITINVSRGTPSFTFILMANDPMNGEILRESAPVDKKTYTFEAVKPGKYFVKIVDSKGMAAGKTVDILTSGSN
jgi:hypothetical protein